MEHPHAWTAWAWQMRRVAGPRPRMPPPSMRIKTSPPSPSPPPASKPSVRASGRSHPTPLLEAPSRRLRLVTSLRVTSGGKASYLPITRPVRELEHLPPRKAFFRHLPRFFTRDAGCGCGCISDRSGALSSAGSARRAWLSPWLQWPFPQKAVLPSTPRAEAWRTGPVGRLVRYINHLEKKQQKHTKTSSLLFTPYGLGLFCFNCHYCRHVVDSRFTSFQVVI